MPALIFAIVFIFAIGGTLWYGTWGIHYFQSKKDWNNGYCRKCDRKLLTHNEHYKTQVLGPEYLEWRKRLSCGEPESEYEFFYCPSGSSVLIHKIYYNRYIKPAPEFINRNIIRSSGKVIKFPVKKI